MGRVSPCRTGCPTKAHDKVIWRARCVPLNFESISVGGVDHISSGDIVLLVETTSKARWCGVGSSEEYFLWGASLCDVHGRGKCSGEDWQHDQSREDCHCSILRCNLWRRMNWYESMQGTISYHGKNVLLIECSAAVYIVEKLELHTQITSSENLLCYTGSQISEPSLDIGF